MVATQHATRNTQHGFFVTGTDTGVGKTLVSCALLRACAARGARVIGMKPVAAGANAVAGELINDDVEQLCAASNVSAPRAWVNPYCFALPVAPHLAAALEKNDIKIKHLQECFERLQAVAEVVVVEGAGGFCVPLNARESSTDLARALALPVVLVVGMRLGCLNHALLTAQAIRACGLTLAGWVANHVDAAMALADENVAALQARLDAPLLARIEFSAAPDVAAIALRINPSTLEHAR